MFKVKNNLCPEILQSLFCKTTYKKISKASFHRPNVNSVYNGEQPLRSFGPIVWDTMIPESMKEISNLNEFKKNITSWFPENCSCRLCKDYISNLGFATL